jgi:probable DNA metabolism protein
MLRFYDGTPEGLFAILEEAARGTPLPDRVLRVEPPEWLREGAVERTAGKKTAPAQLELFGGSPGAPGLTPFSAAGAKTAGAGAAGAEVAGKTGAGAAGGLPAGAGPDREFPVAKELFELSANAYSTFLRAWMSEFPIEAEALRFAWKVISAGREAGGDGGRRAAERAAWDREDPAVRAVLEAARKVGHEIHRLLGFLRFSPNRQGLYAARCSPDHFVLPALGEHFVLRFGETPWVIFDEKRDLALLRPPGEEPRLLPGEPVRDPPPAMPAYGGHDPGPDPWEELWRNYHRSINNESRANPALQRQFIPLRYRKYLSEFPGPQAPVRGPSGS